MRNIKKLLALVLVLVMAMSFATAAYSDVEDNNVAIEVMSGVGVFNGYEDGTFAPNKVLTREEAMKIVAYLDLTAKIAETLEGQAIFTDVAADRWSAGYIAYAYTTGVVDGNGDGTFGPADELTGYAFAKMILNVLGIEGEYTGLLWKTNINKALAENKALLSGLETVNLADPMTRAQAAQMAFNALWITEGAEVATGKYVIVVAEGSAYATELGEIAKIAFTTSLEAMLTVSSVCEEAKLGTDYTVAAQYVADYSDALAGKHDVAPMSYATDDFGVVTYKYESVSVDKKGNPAKTYWTQEEAGIPCVNETLTGKALFAAYAKKDAKELVVTVITNGTDNTATYTIDKDGVYNEDGDKLTVGGNGVETTIYATATGIKVVVKKSYLATVTKLIDAVKDDPKTEADETAAAKAVLSFNGIEAEIETEDYKVGDYLIVVAANGEVVTFEDPTIVGGTLKGYKANTSITLDNGKTLYWAETAANKSVTNFKDALKFLTDGTYVYGIDERVASATEDPVDGYAKVLQWQVSYDGGENSKDLFGETYEAASCAAKAKVQYNDGSVAVVDVTVIYVDEKAATEAMPEGYYFVNPVTFETVAVSSNSGLQTVGTPVWACYQIAEDGSYSFCAIEGAVVVENTALTKGTKTLGGYRLNSATKYVETNNNKDAAGTTTMVGYTNIATKEATDLLVFVNEKTNVITEIYGIVDVAPKAESTDVELEDLYLALKATGNYNAYGAEWLFVVNGDEVAYYVDTTKATIEVGAHVYELTLNDKDVVVAATATDLEKAGVVTFIDELYFDADKSYDFASEYVVYDLETGAVATLEVGDTAYVLTKTVKVNNVDTTVVVLIYVEKAEA